MWRLSWITFAGLVPLLVALSGCSKPMSNQSDGPDAQTTTKPGATKKSTKKQTPRVTEKDGKKYLDDIPYDVWFDDPLAEVSNTASVSPAPSPETVAKNDTPPTKIEDKLPAAAANDWSAYIAAEQLQEESKRLRNQLKSLLQTPASYTSDFEVVKMDGAVMAALGVIASQSDGINWKPNAGYIRDYGFEIFDSAKGPGKPNYDKTNAAYENLQSVFSGSIPAGATEPEPTRPLADVASRFYLMRRMKLAFEALKLNINTEAKLKSDAEQALHDVMVLSALSKVITQDGYSSTDEAEYQQFAKEMIESCLDAAQSVKDQDFTKFQDAINKIDKSCGECHTQYRNG